MKKNYFIYFFIYLIGIFHWLFFFYFVDYYEYKKTDIREEIKITNYNSHIMSVNLDGKFFFKIPISVKKLSDRILKGDKELLKSIRNKADIKNLFKAKKFSENDLYTEHKALEVWKNSIENNIIPYHSSYGVGNGPKLDRFLGNPMITISPQIFLLKFISTQAFYFINLLFMFTIGYLGCIFIKKKFNLGFAAFIIFLLIYNFNGYFITKIPNYGPHFMGYFILPFFLCFVFIASKYKEEIISKKISIGILLGLSNALILLQGSIHLYTISVTFLIFWGIWNYKLYIITFSSFIINFLLSSIKIIPAYLSYGSSENHRYWEAGGYGNLSTFFNGFVSAKEVFSYPPFSIHEFSLYISFFGLLFICIFGFYNFFDDRKGDKQIFKSLSIPVLLLIFISFRHFKHLILPNWIPLLNSESVTSRYMIIPLLVISLIAVINFQNIIKNSFFNLKIKIVTYSFILFLFLSLMNNSRIWRMHQVENKMLWYNKLTSINPIMNNKPLIENNFNDIIYINSFWFGSFITLTTVLFIILWFVKLRFISKIN